jgi:hypothetical protein
LIRLRFSRSCDIRGRAVRNLRRSKASCHRKVKGILRCYWDVGHGLHICVDGSKPPSQKAVTNPAQKVDDAIENARCIQLFDAISQKTVKLSTTRSKSSPPLKKLRGNIQHSESIWLRDRAGPGSVLQVSAFDYPRRPELFLQEARVPCFWGEQYSTLRHRCGYIHVASRLFSGEEGIRR